MEISAPSSLNNLFTPKSICIAGISRRANTLGRKVLSNLNRLGYLGKIYPLNPRAKTIDGLPAYPSLDLLPEVPDMVISLVKRTDVLPLAEKCIEIGVKSLVVITAGFRETGSEGLKLEQKLKEIVAGSPLRLIGPNSMGIVNTSNEIQMDASFTPVKPNSGNIAVISQSGALGAVIMEYCNQNKIGISKFVSVGNKLDINENHLLEFFGLDSQTSVIMCYLESFTDISIFREKSLFVTPNKPVLVVKSGTTEQGSKAAASHTGALAGNDEIADSFLQSVGIVRCRTVKEMVNTSHILSKINSLSGNRVAIVSNAGGPGTLTTDYAVDYGLEISSLSDNTIIQLQNLLPPEATISNPVDILPSADPLTYQQVTATLLNDPGVDIAVVLILPPVLMELDELIIKLDGLYLKSQKPFVVIFMGCESFLTDKINPSFPFFLYPDDAMKSLQNVASYLNWKKNPHICSIVVNKTTRAMSARLFQEQGLLDQNKLHALMNIYNIPVPFSQVVDSLNNLLTAFHKIQGPAVIKLASKILSHKSEYNGIFLNVQTEDSAIDAFHSIYEIYDQFNVPTEDRHILIQEQIDSGIEIVVGAIKDPVFGTAIMIGTGGTLVEIINDVIFLSPPFSPQYLKKKIKELKIFPLLNGYRGNTPINLSSLYSLILNTQQMIIDNPELAELDMNPVICNSKGCWVVDIRASVVLHK